MIPAAWAWNSRNEGNKQIELKGNETSAHSANERKFGKYKMRIVIKNE